MQSTNGYRANLGIGSLARGIVSIAATIACMQAGAQSAEPTGAIAGAERFVAGRILVMPRAGLSEAAVERLVKENGGSRSRKISANGLRIMNVPPGLERAALDKLSRISHFKFAELDRFIPGDLAVNDPMAGSQWHLNKIGANVAWDSTEGSGVTVAVLDTGVDTKHPDLLPNLLPGYNFWDNNTNVEDVHSHGTKTSGALAAAINNGLGVASVAGQVRLLPIRVADATMYATWSAVASGITYAADRGARIASISYSGAAGSASVISAADYMRTKGGLVFVSAGNSNINPGYADTGSLIIVAATGSGDVKSSFSNYGPHIDLSAPGESIYTTTWGQGYTTISGTSFSAPIAAGVAALVMAANPALTSKQVESILFTTAKDLGDPGRDIYYGWGRVDAAAAVAKARTTTTTTIAADTQVPTVGFGAPTASSTVSGLAAVNVSASDNVGVSHVELYVNSTLLASDTASPYGFSWDSTKVANGMVTFETRAYDAAGNIGRSSMTVNVANAAPTADTTAPVGRFNSPGNGIKVAIGNVSVDTSSTDNAGIAGLSLSLSINGRTVASSTGTGVLRYTWNTRKLATGNYTLVLSSRDASGNASNTSVTVAR